jgi:hypothetical protein
LERKRKWEVEVSGSVKWRWKEYVGTSGGNLNSNWDIEVAMGSEEVMGKWEENVEKGNGSGSGH